MLVHGQLQVQELSDQNRGGQYQQVVSSVEMDSVFLKKPYDSSIEVYIEKSFLIAELLLYVAENK